QWQVPLVSVPGADGFDGQLTAHFVDTELREAHAVGLTGTREPAANRGPAPSKRAGGQGDFARAFHYEGAAGISFPSLALTTRSHAAEGVARETSDRGLLVVSVEPDGQVLHDFGFRLRNWRQR